MGASEGRHQDWAALLTRHGVVLVDGGHATRGETRLLLDFLASLGADLYAVGVLTQRDYLSKSSAAATLMDGSEGSPSHVLSARPVVDLPADPTAEGVAEAVWPPDAPKYPAGSGFANHSLAFAVALARGVLGLHGMDEPRAAAFSPTWVGWKALLLRRAAGPDIAWRSPHNSSDRPHEDALYSLGAAPLVPGQEAARGVYDIEATQRTFEARGLCAAEPAAPLWCRGPNWAGASGILDAYYKGEGARHCGHFLRLNALPEAGSAKEVSDLARPISPAISPATSPDLARDLACDRDRDRDRDLARDLARPRPRSRLRSRPRPRHR